MPGQAAYSLKPLDHCHAGSQHFPAFVLVGIALSAALLAGWYSQGVYHEDDLTHYQIARWSVHDPRYLLDSWGRPGFTVLFSLVAWAGDSVTGLQASRALSAALSAATAWLAFATARHLGFRHAWAAVGLLWLQPLFARLALTTLTETPLALYFALATYLLLTRRTALSAAVMALGPITRDESMVLLGIWAIAMWQARAKFWHYPLLLWAVVAHNLASGWALNIWPAMRWLEPHVPSHYGHGTILTFVPKLVLGCGPVVVGLAMLGVYRMRSKPLGWVVVAAPLTWFAVETAVYMQGAFASGGYARFLVPICPWLAVLAVGGIERLAEPGAFQRMLGRLLFVVAGLWIVCEIEWRWRMPTLPPGWEFWNNTGRLMAAALCVALLVWGWRLRAAGRPRPISTVAASLCMVGLAGVGLIGFMPLQLTPHQAAIRATVEANAQAIEDDRPLLAANRWVYHWADRWVAWGMGSNVDRLLAEAPAGSIFVWEQHFCMEPPNDLRREELCGDSGWLQIWPAPVEGAAARLPARADAADPSPCHKIDTASGLRIAVFERQRALRLTSDEDTADLLQPPVPK